MSKFVRTGGLNVGGAIYYAGTGEADAMFEALDGAWDRRDMFLRSVQTMSFFDPYRNTDPRCQNLLKRMSL